MQSSRRDINPVETYTRIRFSNRLPNHLTPAPNLIVKEYLSIMVVVMVVAMLASILHHLSQNGANARVRIVVR
jgi:hypothetical protein